ncbi:MAG TPA: hypothetical protein VD884_22105 [Ohtaekwangia sp.]|nr:hypothetical protein [Ohtaekwangia sp.]
MVKDTKKSNVFSVSVGILLALLFAFAIYQFFFTSPTYEQELKRAVKTLNESCPMMVDEETRLDEVLVLPENKIAYKYSLVNMVKRDTEIQDLKASLEPEIIANVKTNPDMQINRDHKTTLIYRYLDKHGAFLFEITVTPALYME